LRNIGAPVTFANDLLQGEGKRAGTTLARFGINSTIGVLGIFDPATDMGFESHTEDFGQTLATWGVPSGPYLFLPVIGPTNFRDGPGRVVDLAFQPLNYAAFEGDDAVRTVRLGASAIAARESVLEAVDDLRDTSLDPYVSYRSSYGLFRYSAIQNGRRDVQDLPEFEEIPDYDDAAPAEQPTAAPPADLPAEPAEPDTQEQPAPAIAGQAEFSAAYIVGDYP